MRLTDHVLPALHGIGAVVGAGCLVAAVLKNEPAFVLFGFAMLLTSRDAATDQGRT